MPSKNMNLVRCFKAATVASAVGAGMILHSSPAGAQVRCDLNGVAGVPIATQGADSLVCGNPAGSFGVSDDLTAIGEDLAYNGDQITVIGTNSFAATSAGFNFDTFAPPFGDGTTVIGAFAAAAGAGNVAIGDGASIGQFTLSGGGLIVDQTANAAIAIGSGAAVFENQGTALGASAFIYGENGTALGYNSVAFSDDATAVGSQAGASGVGSVAIGRWAGTSGAGAIAIGGDVDGDTFGAGASADGAIAIGGDAQATAAGSVAIGAGSVANAANTVSVGAAGSERRIVNVAAGTAATDAVNVSQLNAVSGNVTALQTTVNTNTAQIATLNTNVATNTTQITAIQAVNTTQSSQISALQAAQDALDADIDTLFDLRGRDRRDMKQGVAAAMSMAQAPMPSGPGRVSYAVNGATFRGEYAVGASLNYRLNTQSPMAVSVGASFAGNKNNGFRLGVAGEF